MANNKYYTNYSERTIDYDKKTDTTKYRTITTNSDGSIINNTLFVKDRRPFKSDNALSIFKIIIAILLAVNMFTLINSPSRDIITTKDLLTTLQSVPDVSIPSIANVTLDNVPNFIESFINSFISMINFSTTVVNMATQTLTFIFWILHDLLGF